MIGTLRLGTSSALGGACLDVRGFFVFLVGAEPERGRFATDGMPGRADMGVGVGVVVVVERNRFRRSKAKGRRGEAGSELPLVRAQSLERREQAAAL